MLETLRNKSDATKKVIAFWTSALITLLILVVWASSLPTRLSNVEININLDADRSSLASVSETRSAEGDRSDSSVFDMVGNIFARVGTIFKGTFRYNSAE